MEECESLDSEMTDLQEFQCEASETISQDDDDEVEELQNSLREVVQDPSVKPKLQCLMVDPAFSMVTVQSEDSGIVWETASSRCSTPWASETSSISEAYSMEGPGAAGKITIVFDEEKIVRRRTRSGGRSSRLGDRFSRPGSSRSASALGVERPEMAEVSLPNVKLETADTEPVLEDIKNKDQQLFSLISEGYEILNIRVPSKLPTVDEEESTDLPDNLSYLDQTPKIKSRKSQLNHVLPEEGEILDHQEASEQDSTQLSADTELRRTPTQKETISDIDYFEKFTLVDVVVPGEQAPELREETERPAAEPQVEEQKPVEETAKDSPSVSEESFVFVTDVEIAGEHLDEVFYGEGASADAMQQREDDEADDGARLRRRRESQRSGKESGSVLFGSEETTLTPIFISSGPPKIIDPILLEEPTAMSFMYSDLYEDAIGERRKSDGECSEAGSVASEKCYKRRLSDSEEADGYLEKFTLKDEIPTVEVQAEPVEERRGGRMMWSQSKFEMTGCLTRVVKEEDEYTTKTAEPQMQEVSVGDKTEDLKPATFEEKKEPVTETEKQEAKLSVEPEESTVREASIQVSIQESKEREDPMQDQEVKHEVKIEQTEPPESSADEPPPETELTDSKEQKTEESEAHQIDVPAIIVETEQLSQAQEVVEKTEIVNSTEETAVITPVSEEPQTINESEIPLETTEKRAPEEAATDTKMVAADVEVATEVTAEAPAEVKEPETAENQPLTSAEIETPAEMSNEATEVSPEDAAPVKVITETKMVAADEKVLTVVTAEATVEVKELKTSEKEPLTSAEIETSAETSKEAAEAAPKDAAPVEVIPDTKMVAADEKVLTVVTAEATVEVKELKTSEKEPLTSAEIETSAETSKEAAEVAPKDAASVEVITGTKMVAADEKVITEVTVEASAEVKEPETAEKELLTSAEIETSGKASKEAAEVAPEDAAPVEVITDCDAAVRAVVEVTEKAVDEKEIQTQVQIDLQEAASVETTYVQSAAPEGKDDALAEESQVVEILPEADQVSEAKTEVLSEETEPGMPEVEQHEILQQNQQEDSVTESELDKTKLMPEAKDPSPTEDTAAALQEAANVGDELILLVPKGQAVEMDIEMSVGLVKPTVETIALSEPECVVAPETTSVCPETPQAPNEESMPEPHIEVKPEVVLKEEALPINELDDRYPLPAPVEEEQKMESDFEKDEGVFSPLRSFTPREDLSALHGEDVQSETADIEQKAEMHEVEEAPGTTIVKEDINSEIELHREDVGQGMEQDEAAAEAPEATFEEFDYEVITEQDAKEIPKPETQRDAEELKRESGQVEEEKMEREREEEEEKVFDVSPEEEPIEADYEIIDAEEEGQARLAAELEGMDWFCLTCSCLLSEDDCASGEHRSHEVTAVDKVYEEIKEKLSDWISELQGRSENIEDLVSELELAYNSVEDQCVETEAAMQVQNEEMMALVMEQYNNMSVSMEEEKKAKLEQLYDQIVSFQESIDSAKATLETTAREAETDARSPEDIFERLSAALDTAMSLELGPKGLLVFEDYAKGNTSSSHLAQRKGIPVPQRPTLQPQEPGSATSASVTVYWKVNPGDIIDCFQVYCMEDPQGAVSEEYRVTVKESYCVLEELEPDKTYKVWVMAVNYTGCSLPSERLDFRTAPSVPVIDTECCTVMWDSATLRWSSAKQTPEQSYTLEYCRQYELEGEGLRSISGIQSCEQKVVLQPNENYLFYIKAVNEAGASEQSEAALISTKGTKFHLLKASAHPALELSEDQTTLHYSQDAPENTLSEDRQCPSILGELLLAQGHHYWETVVSRSTAYRLGVAYSTADRNSPLGENSLSWCLQCIPTPSGYQLLHTDVQSSVFVIEMPDRVGTLLDYQLGRLSFYNAQSGQLLGTFCHRFTQPCHPALGLDMPGSLEVSMVLEVPAFTKDS